MHSEPSLFIRYCYICCFDNTCDENLPSYWSAVPQLRRVCPCTGSADAFYTGALYYVDADRMKNEYVRHGSIKDMVFSPDSKFLYAASRMCTEPCFGGVIVFSADENTGKFSEVDFVDPSPSWDVLEGLHLAMSPDGKHLYAGQNGGPTSAQYALIVFSRDAITGRLTQVEVLGDGLQDQASNTISGMPGGVSSVIHHPTINVVYVEGYDLASDPAKGLAVFNRNPSTGVLTFRESFPVLNHPNPSPDAVITPDGNNFISMTHIDVLNFFVWTVYNIDSATGALALFSEWVHNVTDHPASMKAALAVSPDSNFLYTTHSHGIIIHKLKLLDPGDTDIKFDLVAMLNEKDSEGTYVEGSLLFDLDPPFCFQAHSGKYGIH